MLWEYAIVARYDGEVGTVVGKKGAIERDNKERKWWGKRRMSWAMVVLAGENGGHGEWVGWVDGVWLDKEEKVPKKEKERKKNEANGVQFYVLIF